MSEARTRGRRAEDAALRHLERMGLHVVARNYRCRRGEIDLVMHGQDTLVFVEVRFRSREDFGSAAESVDARKQRRIVTAARHYLLAHPADARRACRFDVVSVRPERAARAQPAREPTGGAGNLVIEWIPDAFRA